MCVPLHTLHLLEGSRVRHGRLLCAPVAPQVVALSLARDHDGGHEAVLRPVDPLVAGRVGLREVEPQALVSSDDFRKQYCYVEAVSLALVAQKRNLRTLFEVYADFPNIKPADQKVLSLEDWMLLLKHLHFFDEAFQQREGVLCFVQSRMRAVDEESERGKKRMKHLNFEDFLEALVRVSTMKALPTDEEVEEAGVADGGDFVLRLRQNSSDYQAWIDEWYATHQAPINKASQPAHRALDALILLIVRTIEGAATSFHANLQVSPAEMSKWCQAKLKLSGKQKQ